MKGLERNRFVPAINWSSRVDSLFAVDIPFAATLLLGGPGETPETIAETMDLVNSPRAPRYLIVSIGIALWTNHQRIVKEARTDDQLADESGFFEETSCLSPELTEGFLQEFVNSLQAQDNCVRYYINKASCDEVVEMVPWESYGP